MRIERGDLVDAPVTGRSWLIATASSTLNQNRRLVMGAGAALSLKRKYPGCDRAFGQAIKMSTKDLYGVLLWRPPVPGSPTIGVLQTKFDWRAPSTLELVRFSINKLKAMIQTDGQADAVHVNYPGIGLGGLTEELVFPIIETLPDLVTVWKL